jgi:hypothetical protein
MGEKKNSTNHYFGHTVDGKGALDRELRTVTPTRSLICLHEREGLRRACASIPLHFAQFLSVSCDALRWEHTGYAPTCMPCFRSTAFTSCFVRPNEICFVLLCSHTTRYSVRVYSTFPARGGTAVCTGKHCAGGLYCVQHCNIVKTSFVDELCEKNHPLSTHKFLEHY